MWSYSENEINLLVNNLLNEKKKSQAFQASRIFWFEVSTFFGVILLLFVLLGNTQ